MRKGDSRQRRRISGRRSRWKRSSGSRSPSGSRRKSIMRNADGCRWSSGWFSCSLWWFSGWNPAAGRWMSILFWIADEISHPTHFRHSPRWMAPLNDSGRRWQTLRAFFFKFVRAREIQKYFKKMLDWIYSNYPRSIYLGKVGSMSSSSSWMTSGFSSSERRLRQPPVTLTAT